MHNRAKSTGGSDTQAQGYRHHRAYTKPISYINSGLKENWQLKNQATKKKTKTFVIEDFFHFESDPPFVFLFTSLQYACCCIWTHYIYIQLNLSFTFSPFISNYMLNKPWIAWEHWKKYLKDFFLLLLLIFFFLLRDVKHSSKNISLPGTTEKEPIFTHAVFKASSDKATKSPEKQVSRTTCWDREKH